MTALHVAFEIPGLRVGVWPANADLSAETNGVPTYQFVAVELAVPGAGVDGSSGAALQIPASAGDAILGILQDNPAKNQPGDVFLQGVSKAVMSGSVVPGSILATDTAGKLKAATGGQFGVAMALSTGSSGDIIAVWIHNFGKQ